MKVKHNRAPHMTVHNVRHDTKVVEFSTTKTQVSIIFENASERLRFALALIGQCTPIEITEFDSSLCQIAHLYRLGGP